MNRICVLTLFGFLYLGLFFILPFYVYSLVYKGVTWVDSWVGYFLGILGTLIWWGFLWYIFRPLVVLLKKWAVGVR